MTLIDQHQASRLVHGLRHCG